MSRFYRAGLGWVPTLLLLAGGWMASDQADVSSRRIDLPLADTSVSLLVHQTRRPGLTYLSLHDDEDTAIQAMLATLPQLGGRLFELRHTGERNIRFALDGQIYAFDPNRIFTDPGIQATLAHFGASSRQARRAVRQFAEALLQQLEREHTPVLVAVHNNTDGRYSVLSYAPGGSCAGDAERVHLAPGQDPDDFFLVTDPHVFEALRAFGFNVVLQDTHAADDGSLSVYAARRGLSYVNVEAQHGHLAEQRAMLMALQRVIDVYPAIIRINIQ